MKVTFHKQTERRSTYWQAVRGRRTVVPGSTMALGRGDMPHDLKQLVVEATVGIEDGFWGSVAAGATFKSTGRKRTKPGRAIIAANRRGLIEAERITGHHVAQWRRGCKTEVAAALTEMDRDWAALPAEGTLTVEWPSLRRLADPAEG